MQPLPFWVGSRLALFEFQRDLRDTAGWLKGKDRLTCARAFHRVNDHAKLQGYLRGALSLEGFCDDGKTVAVEMDSESSEYPRGLIDRRRVASESHTQIWSPDQRRGMLDCSQFASLHSERD
jgi:hypothetical protein